LTKVISNIGFRAELSERTRHEKKVFPHENPKDKVDILKAKKDADSQNFSVPAIVSFAVGALGLGVALKVGHVNKNFNKKVIEMLDNVGIKAEPVTNFFKKNLENLEKLDKALVKDKLTGIFNRQYLDEYLNKAFKHAQKNNSGLHIFIMDIDKFKNVNTGLGHDGGDEILIRTAKIISEVAESLKIPDVKTTFARAGGEEFALVVEGATKQQAIQIAQKMRKNINQDPTLQKNAAKLETFFEMAIKDLKSKPFNLLKEQEKQDLAEFAIGLDLLRKNKGFTISSGVMSLSEINKNGKIVEAPHEAIKLADLTLQRTKDMGRNKLFGVNSSNIDDFASIKLKQLLEKTKLSEADRSNLSILVNQSIEKINALAYMEDKQAELAKAIEFIKNYKK